MRWRSGWIAMCSGSLRSRARTASRVLHSEKMPRDLLVGNGCLLVAFDAQYRLADLYYPHVGLENHVGERFRFGVWADDAVTWIEAERWQCTLTYLRETIVTDVRCQSDS